MQEMTFGEAAKEILSRLEKMEFALIDDTVYDNVPERRGQTAVTVVYLPQTACMMCVELYHTYTRFYVIFGLAGQLNGPGFPSRRLKIEKHRSTYQSQSEEGDFFLQFEVDFFETVDDQIIEGMEFIEEFLDENRQIFAPRFKRIPILPVLPTQTVRYQETVNGPKELLYYDLYMKTMVPKFPAEIMPLKAPADSR